MPRTCVLLWNNCGEKVSTKSECRYLNNIYMSTHVVIILLFVRRQRALAALNVTESIAMEREGKD